MKYLGDDFKAPDDAKVTIELSDYIFIDHCHFLAIF